MKTVNWGIIGCGDVAEVKSGPAFKNVHHSSLLAVMRRNKEKAEDFAKRHQVPYHFDDAQAVLAHPEINAVYIATPPSTHLQYALQGLEANKDVYLEKPMTLNTAEAEQLCEALKNSSSKLTVAHYRRRLPAFLKVKELLDHAKIGEIISVDIQILQPKMSNIIATTEEHWRLDPSISGGGYFHDLAPHQLDLMLHWLGPVERYAGYATNEDPSSKVATTVNGIMHFKNGVQFRGLWSFNTAEDKKDECKIYGTTGNITFSFYGDKVILNKNGETFIFDFENPVHIQQPMIEATVKYFSHLGPNPCSASEGLAVMKVMDAFTK
ncbi:Gfo/Idh/MocA family protein [Sungkyunkwania multivorans]|uniref:Gfo/Idh/MocA family protein n=1 Tax=Sungkyunkwania multivorans TaxID=1173618 RepID=A0ABW3CV50_9FLAO